MACVAYIPYGHPWDEVVFFCFVDPDEQAICSHPNCPREAVVLCDAEGCDKPLCLEHSAQASEGRHYCHTHAIYFGDLPLGQHVATMPNDLAKCQGLGCPRRTQLCCMRFSAAKPGPAVLFWDGYALNMQKSVGACKYFEPVKAKQPTARG